jgi:RimJ/RimL family protein N-acetyltransferase
MLDATPMPLSVGARSARGRRGGKARLWRQELEVAVPPEAYRRIPALKVVFRLAWRCRDAAVNRGSTMARKRVNPADVTLRPWALSDAEALMRLGDDRDIWLNLRHRFPHPFTAPAADLWLAEHINDHDVMNWSQKSFAIWWRDELTGGVLLKRRENVHRICADLTFWVGRPFWGRGIARAAVRAATAYAFDILLGLERIQTFVFDWTAESTGVPEGPGYAEAARVL